MKFNPSILEYLGKIDDGILILISIVYSNKYYEGTLFYTQDNYVLTTSENLEIDLGCSITEDPDYEKLMEIIKKKIVPYDEMFSRLDEINIEKWAQITKGE